MSVSPPLRQQSPLSLSDHAIAVKSTTPGREYTSLDIRINDLDDRIQRAKRDSSMNQVSATTDEEMKISRIRQDIVRIKSELTTRYGTLQETISMWDDDEAKEVAAYTRKLTSLASSVRATEDQVAKTTEHAKAKALETEKQTRTRDELLLQQKQRALAFEERLTAMEANEKELLETYNALRAIVRDLQIESQTLRLQVSDTEKNLSEKQRERDRVGKSVHQLTAALGELKLVADRASHNQIEDRLSLNDRVSESEKALLVALDQQRALRLALTDLEDKGRGRVQALTAERNATGETLRETQTQLACLQTELAEKEQESVELRKQRKAKDEENMQMRIQERRTELGVILKEYEAMECDMRRDKDAQMVTLKQSLEASQKQLSQQRAHRDAATEEMASLEVSVAQASAASLEGEALRARKADLEARIWRLKEQCSAHSVVKTHLEIQLRETVEAAHVVQNATSRFGELNAEESSLRHKLFSLQRELTDKASAGEVTRTQIEVEGTTDSNHLQSLFDEMQRLKTENIDLPIKCRTEVDAAHATVATLQAELHSKQKRMQEMQRTVELQQVSINELVQAKARLEEAGREALAAGESLVVRLQNIL